MCSVGCMGDERIYYYVLELYVVLIFDFMTSEPVEFLWEVLNMVTRRNVNEVKCINRVFYDCIRKLLATIEL